MFTECSLDVHWMFTKVVSRLFHRELTGNSQAIHRQFTLARRSRKTIISPKMEVVSAS
jgi:hypothetical protein